MILKALITLIFVGAAVQKFNGKVAPNWERWGYSRKFMYATGIAELVALAVLLVAGARTRGCSRPLSGAARRTCDADQAPRRTIPYRSPAFTLVLVVAQSYRVDGRVTCKEDARR